MFDIDHEVRDRKVLTQTDGHYCPDWDELAVSAWTPEYDCCCCSKTLLGRFFNWLFMIRFRFAEWCCRRRECLKSVRDNLARGPVR